MLDVTDAEIATKNIENRMNGVVVMIPLINLSENIS
jgi:hypothetical protein